jgi:hypothetical protein
MGLRVRQPAGLQKAQDTNAALVSVAYLASKKYGIPF